MNKNVLQIAFMALAITFIQPVVCGGTGPGDTLKCVAPAYLKAGDTVALIAPSYHLPIGTVKRAAQVLRQWGFVPVIGPNADKIHADKYAGTVKERVEDIRWALESPGVKAVICVKGGYGALHLMDEMLAEEFAASPKWIVGFSDITTLFGIEVCAGVMGIHGVLGFNIASRNSTDASCALLRDLLKGQVPRYEVPANDLNIPGHATGTLVGGNLCTFASLPALQSEIIGKSDIILFLEEIEESMHHIDRMFNMLKNSGMLSHCRGVVLGGFTGCKADLGYESVEAMLREYIEPYGIPLLCGFPAGHDKVNLPLVMGAPVTLDVRADGATLAFDIPGTPRRVRTGELSQPVPATVPEEDASQFVNLTDVIPDAILEIRYFSTYNFVGQRIDGYLQPTALMTRRAADSLKAVSDDVMRMGYRLKIYDAYRPQMAVDHFVRWASDISDTSMRRYFYPKEQKSQLFVRGYIASKSGHTRGSTVDLTLFDMATEKELDMGGTFDWFGEESHPSFGGNPATGHYVPNGRITEEQFRNRMILRQAMMRHGFKPIGSEWWHFTLKDEPFPNTYFTFPVQELER